MTFAFTLFNELTGDVDSVIQCDSEDGVSGYLVDGRGNFPGIYPWEDYYFDKNGKPVEYSPTQKAKKASRPYYSFTWSNDLMDWVDVRTLDQIKSEKWEAVKAQRDAQEFGTFTWSGHTFDGDEAAQRRINLAVMGAQAALLAGDAGWSVAWTLADNSSVNLSASDMIGVANALGANIAQAHAAARAKRQQIEQATTKEELDVL